MTGLGFARMYSSCDNNGLLLTVVPDKVEQPLTKIVKGGARIYQLVLIRLVELLDFGFDDLH